MESQPPAAVAPPPPSKPRRHRWIVSTFILAVIAMTTIAIMFLRHRERSRRDACIANLRQIEAAKDQLTLESGRDWRTWRWESDEQAFKAIVSIGTGYIHHFPLCPSSTTDTPNVAQSAADYDVNPIGINAVCTVDKTHVLP